MYKDLNYHRKYYLKNKEKIKQYNKKTSYKSQKKYHKNHKEKRKKYMKKWRKEHRWHRHYYKARDRCLNCNNVSYKYYGAKGIKFLMTLKNFKFLWFRDKAYLMKRPSIDRKDNNGHYILKNCRFMEFSKNISKSNIERNKVK